MPMTESLGRGRRIYYSVFFTLAALQTSAGTEIRSWHWVPTIEEHVTLGAVAQRFEKAVVFLENKRGGCGTAFCIHREQGLFLTNAHCVDQKSQFRIVSLAGERFPVRRLWIHPDIGRRDKPFDPGGSNISALSCDVAILQADLGGGVWPVAYPLARPGQGKRILGRAVAETGFPTYAQPQANRVQRPNPATMYGVAYALWPLTDVPNRPPPDWCVGMTTPLWRGASGSPIFDEDGTVVAVHNAGGLYDGGTGVYTYQSCGILVDAVWELLASAEGIQDVLQPERDGVTLGDHQLPDRTRSFYEPPDDAVQQLSEAKHLRQTGHASRAMPIVDRLVKDHPWWWEPYAERAKLWNEVHESYHREGGADSRKCLAYETQRWKDAAMALRLNPVDLDRHIALGYALCGLSAARGERNSAAAAQNFAERGLQKRPPPYLEAQFRALRA
jgi:trypsin-like peptidase